jgi:hypothetical protein
VVVVVFATDKNHVVDATSFSSRAERLLALFKSSTKRSGAKLRDIKNINRYAFFTESTMYIFFLFWQKYIINTLLLSSLSIAGGQMVQSLEIWTEDRLYGLNCQRMEMMPSKMMILGMRMRRRNIMNEGN